MPLPALGSHVLKMVWVYTSSSLFFPLNLFHFLAVSLYFLLYVLEGLLSFAVWIINLLFSPLRSILRFSTGVISSNDHSLPLLVTKSHLPHWRPSRGSLKILIRFQVDFLSWVLPASYIFTCSLTSWWWLVCLFFCQLVVLVAVCSRGYKTVCTGGGRGSECFPTGRLCS